MYRIKGAIVGIAPLLFNKPPLTLDGSGGRVSEAKRIQEAENRAYRDENGLYLPPENFINTLVNGCKKANIKIKGQTSLASYLEATVFVEGELRFGKDTWDFMHERMGHVPPKTGALALIRRPALNPGWCLQFQLLVLEDWIKAGDIKKSLDTGGTLVGMCSWRPQHGRFIVRDWSVEN